MAIDFEAEVEAGYMRIRCRGTFEQKSMLEVYERALDRAAAEGLAAVLVDVRDVEGTPPTTLERYEFGVHVAKLQSAPGKRIRMAVVGNEPMIDPQRFGETVAKNRGAIGKVFTDIDEALAWIQNTAT